MHNPLIESVAGGLAEIQGLYGAFSFPEKLLQKIWLRRDFDVRAARTVDGRRVQVVHPGRWNLLGGPDFKLARLRFADGPEVVGDVELHLRASDWDAHAHARDPAYAGVLLHVVLFPPERGYVTRGAGGAEIPMLALLPLLHHDLEEYAAEEAVELLANRPAARLTNELAVHAPADLRTLLELYAAGRWRQKVHFAGLRLQRLGWEASCHHAALEVLGYRYNRAPMLRVAARWPLADWAAGRVGMEEVLAIEADAWSVQGVRPANQPRARLRQYAAWVAAKPSWPAELARWGEMLPAIPAAGETRTQRRLHRLPAVRDQLAEEVGADAVGGSRLDNLVCDAFLPLLAARSRSDDRRGWWFHWFGGDVPPFVAAGLRQLGVCDGRVQPFCHGLAQGLLGWLIEREVRR
ncbi:DUF2851 family protein [Opitutus sp. ER46]|uniref:DUF2851 family protein n=1 Tax=Opitutus sp. ER46 TaxID=2161864 RepID=UPI000D30E02A|nr:DUF2851 family protein [Opitutus sp. ER46]PTX91141.1 DUF2851 domain-containing protein [Opitutus sp. ER46]